MLMVRRAFPRLALVTATLAACEPAPAYQPATADGTPPAAAADVRRCPAVARPGQDWAARAVTCAEAFVARNGYTDLAPADATQLADESIEVGTTTVEVLASRRGTLARRAAAVCRGTPGAAAGYTVAFAAAGDRARRYGTAVTMDSAFGQLRVQHQGVQLGAVLAHPPRDCRVLAGSA
ncbi:MAG TPA: hypothetical protein VGD56_17580 [Gemmatirosa sp.]